MEEDSDSSAEYGLEIIPIRNCVSGEFPSEDFHHLISDDEGKSDDSSSELFMSPREDFNFDEVKIVNSENKSVSFNDECNGNEFSCEQKPILGSSCKTEEFGVSDREKPNANLSAPSSCSRICLTTEVHNKENSPRIVSCNIANTEVGAQREIEDNTLGSIVICISEGIQCSIREEFQCDQSTQCEILLLNTSEKCDKSIQCSILDATQTAKYDVSTQYENPLTSSCPNIESQVKVTVSREVQCISPLHRSIDVQCDTYLVSQGTQYNLYDAQKVIESMLPILQSVLDTNNVVSSSQQSTVVSESLNGSENGDTFIELRHVDSDNLVHDKCSSDVNHSVIENVNNTEGANLPEMSEVVTSSQIPIITSSQERTVEDLLSEMNVILPFDSNKKNQNVTYDTTEDNLAIFPSLTLSSQEVCKEDVPLEKNVLVKTEKDDVFNASKSEENVQKGNDDTNVDEITAGSSKQVDARENFGLSWFNSLACERASSPESLNEETCEQPSRTSPPLHVVLTSSQETLLINSPRKKINPMKSLKEKESLALNVVEDSEQRISDNSSVPNSKNKQRSRETSLPEANKDSKIPRANQEKIDKCLFYNSLACERASSPESLDEDTCTRLSRTSISSKCMEKINNSNLRYLRTNDALQEKSEYSKSSTKNTSKMRVEKQSRVKIKDNQDLPFSGTSSRSRKLKSVNRTVEFDLESIDISVDENPLSKFWEERTNNSSSNQTEMQGNVETKQNENLLCCRTSSRSKKMRSVNRIIESDSESSDVSMQELSVSKHHEQRPSNSENKRNDKQSKDKTKECKNYSHSGTYSRSAKMKRNNLSIESDSELHNVSVHQPSISKSEKRKNEARNWYAELRKKWARHMVESLSDSFSSGDGGTKEKEIKRHKTERSSRERNNEAAVLNTSRASLSKRIVPYNDTESDSSEEAMKSPDANENPGPSKFSKNRQMRDEGQESSSSSISNSDCSQFDWWQPTEPKRTRTRQVYTHHERELILKYIIKHKKYNYTSGNVMWKDMEDANVCPGRTWQSLKEHYRKQILPKIKSFHFPRDIESKFR